ncbi:MAG: hypothetical protein ACREBQ_08650, partial [Nitrososphaerales archaeon]
MDKDLFYVSLTFLLIGIGGQLAWYFFGVVPNTQASMQEMQNVSGYIMLVGFLILPAGLFKDGMPAPGTGAKIFIGVVLVLLVGIAFTGVLLMPAASGPVQRPETFVQIPSGAGGGQLPAYYLPVTITVVIGFNNTVQWTNADNTAHSVTANSNMFNS